MGYGSAATYIAWMTARVLSTNVSSELLAMLRIASSLYMYSRGLTTSYGSFRYARPSTRGLMPSHLSCRPNSSHTTKRPPGSHWSPPSRSALHAKSSSAYSSLVLFLSCARIHSLSSQTVCKRSIAPVLVLFPRAFSTFGHFSPPTRVRGATARTSQLLRSVDRLCCLWGCLHRPIDHPRRQET